jgi:hypothetical protein
VTAKCPESDKHTHGERLALPGKLGEIFGKLSKAPQDFFHFDTQVSGYKSNNSIWLQSNGVKELKSISASSSWRGIFSKG